MTSNRDVQPPLGVCWTRALSRSLTEKELQNTDPGLHASFSPKMTRMKRIVRQVLSALCCTQLFMQLLLAWYGSHSNGWGLRTIKLSHCGFWIFFFSFPPILIVEEQKANYIIWFHGIWWAYQKSSSERYRQPTGHHLGERGDKIWQEFVNHLAGLLAGCNDLIKSFLQLWTTWEDFFDLLLRGQS